MAPGRRSRSGRYERKKEQQQYEVANMAAEEEVVEETREERRERKRAERRARKSAEEGSQQQVSMMAEEEAGEEKPADDVEAGKEIAEDAGKDEAVAEPEKSDDAEAPAAEEEAAAEETAADEGDKGEDEGSKAENDDEAPEGSKAEDEDENPAESEVPASTEVPADSSGDLPAASSASGPDSLSSFGSSVPGSSSDAYMRKIRLKKGARGRYMMYVMCAMYEAAAQELLNYALDTPYEKDQILRTRRELLAALYELRWISDVDDDFTVQEYEKEMSSIKIFRAKMSRLAAKEQVQKDSDATESSDDSDGEEAHLAVLREARKEMQYTFGVNEL